MAHEDIVLDGHPLADEGVGRDLHVPPDPGPLLNLHEGAHPGVVSDVAVVQVHEVEDLDVDARPYVSQTLLRIVRHSLTSRPRRLMDISAASKIFTTFRPLTPLVSGARPSLMAATNSPAMRYNASVVSR